LRFTFKTKRKAKFIQAIDALVWSFSSESIDELVACNIFSCCEANTLAAGDDDLLLFNVSLSNDKHINWKKSFF
jgi:hypothetical protein